MNAKQIKLFKDTIKDLIAVIDPDPNDSDYVDRLMKKKEAVEVGHVALAQLENME